MKDNSINKTVRQLGLVALLVGLLIGWGCVYQAGAQAPQSETGLTKLISSTPTPTIDIRTKLQPYQLSGVEPSQAEGRLLKKAHELSTTQDTLITALAQQTFLATADATVLEGYASQNFGNTIDMWAGYDDSLNPDGQIARSLIKFNIASLPANQVITKATLRVYLYSSWDFPGRYRTVTTYRITANWSENSVTWNNRPDYGQSYDSNSIRNDDFDWHEFDVTDLVAAWYDGTFTNNGIMLRGPEFSGSDSSWRGFSTREGPFTPQLVIEHGAQPDPPSNLTATAISDTQIDLSWQSNSDDEDGFKIERSPDGTIWTQIDTVGSGVTDYSDTGLTCETTYIYRVQAYNQFGDSDYSNTAQATTFTCAPDNLVATAVSDSQINLAWQDNSANETGFEIERSPDGVNWSQIETVGVDVTNYANIDLACDTTYHYRVRATNNNGDSQYSNIANATTSACSYPVYLPFVIK